MASGRCFAITLALASFLVGGCYRARIDVDTFGNARFGETGHEKIVAVIDIRSGDPPDYRASLIVTRVSLDGREVPLDHVKEVDGWGYRVPVLESFRLEQGLPKHKIIVVMEDSSLEGEFVIPADLESPWITVTRERVFDVGFGVASCMRGCVGCLSVFQGG